jgi:hypothetical protein
MIPESSLRAIRIRMSNTCSCGEPKNPGTPFCTEEMLVIPPELRVKLRRRIGHGFEEAFIEVEKFFAAIPVETESA